MPNRGATPTAGWVYVVMGIPLPAWTRPFVRLPEFGTIVPMASVVFGPRNCCVNGFIACRFVPVHGYTPLAQPAIYITGAADAVHFSRKKFDAWPRASYWG